MDVVNGLIGWLWLVPVIFLIVAYKFTLRLGGVVVVPKDSVGVVEKKFVVVGKNRTLPDGAVVALNGEAGYQADTLAPGLHYGLWPWQYSVKLEKFVTIEEGTLGIVESRDGSALPGGRVLARQVSCDTYQNARGFLTGGGERGPQIAVMPPGTYRINSALFSISIAKALDIPDNMVGIVTTKEGASLTTGDIAGSEVSGHNMFQNGQAFIDNGGNKGLQEQVMLAGRYYINPRFAAVELVTMTQVPIANVGVVIAYIGSAGVDVSGDAFRHGNLVSKGQKGVWAEPLDPGKYPINTYTHKVELVPTANVVLNWANNKSEAHKLDERLSSITVRSCDGFSYNLDVSQIIHIPRNDAPKVIARFGSVANLVTQVLEPTIGNYFRNAAQGSDVIDFLRNRVERQEEARKAIGGALTEYNVGAVNTLIGDIAPPEQLMKTLTDRKLAEQQKVTFETQRLAEGVRKDLQQATALANTQPAVVDAERSVSIAEFRAQAAIKMAEGEAGAKTLNAEADATVLRTVGAAEAEKIQKVGTSEADVIKQKINSITSDNYAIIETAKALASSTTKLVPEIMAGGGGGADGQGGTLVNMLIGLMLKDHLETKVK